jgi:YegS/Rv2252/BmrU family lipid kinase
MQYWFIFNPKSGSKSAQKISQVEGVIARQAALCGAVVVLKTTTHPGHATELAREAVAQQINVVVAVGGDGTINEVAKALLHTSTALGIVPMGSGNGLARHLGISMNLQQAVKRVFSNQKHLIDSALLNKSIPFFCTAGVGFDAHIAAEFAQQQQRGFFTYVKTSFVNFWTYQPQQYQFGGQTQTLFTLTFANASQFGNNAYIAPQASTTDGLLDVCALRPFSALAALGVAWRLFAKSLDKSAYAIIEQHRSFELTTPRPALIHYDGESLQLTTTHIQVEIVPNSLWIK